MTAFLLTGMRKAARLMIAMKEGASWEDALNSAIRLEQMTAIDNPQPVTGTQDSAKSYSAPVLPNTAKVDTIAPNPTPADTTIGDLSNKMSELSLQSSDESFAIAIARFPKPGTESPSYISRTAAPAAAALAPI